MNEILLVTCHKDSGGGIAVLDLNTCTPASQNFKNCIADAGTSCLVGSGATSFSGVGSSGDYIAVAQSQKPAIHIYQWGKPQPLYQCHIQEITTALASDHSGRYIVGGSKKGWIYLWELSSGALIRSWQAHFKAVTCLQFTRCGTFLVSASDDGMARAWDVTELVDTYSSSALTGALGDRKSKSVTPFRSWSPHTLAVKGVFILGGASPAQNIRVMTCSTDRTVVMYDIHAAKQVLRISMPCALESLTCSAMRDFAFAGASNGDIYIIDMSVAAIGISAANAVVGHSGTDSSVNSLVASGGDGKQQGKAAAGATSASSSTGLGALPKGVSILSGHSRAVTSLVCSADNTSVVSGSEDGSVRVWDQWSRQCMREVKPLNKTAITNIMVALRPELLGSAVNKPSLAIVAPLRKYATDNSKGGGTNSTSAAGGAGGTASGAAHLLPLSNRIILSPSAVGVSQGNSNGGSAGSGSIGSRTSILLSPPDAVFGSKIIGIGLSRGQNSSNNNENASSVGVDTDGGDEKGDNKRERGDDAVAGAGTSAGAGAAKKSKGGKGMQGEDFISLGAFASGDEMDDHGVGDASEGANYGDEEDGILKFRRDDNKSKDAKGKKGDVAPAVQGKKAGNKKGKK